MNCQNCHQAVEAGAAFCGNCGQPLQTAAATAAAVPLYAVGTPAQHVDETKALLSLLFGVVGIIGALFMALVGLTLGMAGLILGTMSRSSTKRQLSTLGIIASSAAIIAGLCVWVYAVQHNQQQTASASDPTSAAILSANLSTPCYSTGFVDKLNISNDPDSCNMNAFDGQTLASSTNAYKIYANKTQATSAEAFTSLAKQALVNDVKTTLTGFEIDSQKAGTFSGSPAYMVYATDKIHDISVVEAAVLHPTDTGNNVFIMVHAINGKDASLDLLEAQWQWK